MAIEGHYASYPIDEILTREHQHDFFEVFLIADGGIIHHINGTSQLLNSGALVFIRPDDSHFYSKHADHHCNLINLAFLSHTFYSLSDYLGLVEHDDTLITSSLPPLVMLTTNEKNNLITQLEEWGRLIYRDKARSRLTLRSLLVYIFSNYFIARVEDYGEGVPRWLIELCQEMQQKPHLIEGRTALLRLANRTPEYVGRAFKAHLGVTPSQFINSLRLEYASDLLLHADLPVIEVCYEVGFGNLSHFYHLFKARWGCSPVEFRKNNRRTLIP